MAILTDDTELVCDKCLVLFGAALGCSFKDEPELLRVARAYDWKLSDETDMRDLCPGCNLAVRMGY